MKKSISIILALILSTLLVGCSSQTPSQTEETSELTQISLQINWLHSVVTSGVYVASENGHYASENLDLTIKAGGFVDGSLIDPIDEVVSGRSTFGVANGTTLLTARANDIPVVAIAATMQRNPFTLISLRENNIIQPQDLIGKRVQITGASMLLYNALLSSQGIDPSEIELTERTDFTIAPLITGETDVMGGFINNDAVALQLEDYEINTIFLSDYGIDTYSTVFFTTEQTIQNQPAIVHSFLQATVNGIQDVIDDPATATTITENYAEGSTEYINLGIMLSLPLISPAGSNPGMMTSDTWEFTHDLMIEFGALEQAIDIDNAYRLSFIQNIHNNN